VMMMMMMTTIVVSEGVVGIAIRGGRMMIAGEFEGFGELGELG